MSLVSERFKAIQAEAKKIREKNPKLTQAEAVKKAWAIIYSKKSKAGAVGAYYSMFSNEGNKAVTELVKYAKTKKLNRLQVQQKLNKLADTYPEAIDTAVIEKVNEKIFGNIMAKKSPVRKTAKKSAKKTAKKSAAKSMHKDTKSHNVNIRVMSGYNGMQHLKNLVEEKNKIEQKLIAVQNYKNDKNPEVKKHYKFWNARFKKIIASLKKQITEAKKSIQ